MATPLQLAIFSPKFAPPNGPRRKSLASLPALRNSTPVSDAEMRLLTSKPVWRISWCEDERAAQVRSLPQGTKAALVTVVSLFALLVRMASQLVLGRV